MKLFRNFTEPFGGVNVQLYIVYDAYKFLSLKSQVMFEYTEILVSRVMASSGIVDSYQNFVDTRKILRFRSPET
jgi:hypothetical protein